MSNADVAAAAIGAHTAAIVALAVVLGRTRERLVRLEEWARLVEKRLNGERGHADPPKG